MILRTLKLLLLSNILILFIACKGQNVAESTNKNTLPIEKVTSQMANNIWAVFQDSKGNYWFGTVLAGAFRYDGTSFLWIGEKELSRLEDGR